MIRCRAVLALAFHAVSMISGFATNELQSSSWTVAELAKPSLLPGAPGWSATFYVQTIKPTLVCGVL